jgi:hypothetical protein
MSDIVAAGPGHALTVGRVSLGGSRIQGGGTFYGTVGRCSCRQWRHKVNVAPSRGGKKAVENAHEAHVRKVDPDDV